MNKSYLITLGLLVVIFTYSANANLPLTENFSTQILKDESKTTANWSTAEQAVLLAFHSQRLHHLPDATIAGVPISAETNRTRSIALGDVDGDGDLDVVTANSDQFNKLYKNNGAGVFAAAVNIGIDVDDTLVIALGDMDGDGDLDVVVGTTTLAGTGLNKLYINNGAGVFGNAINISADADATQDLVLGDMNGDGALDVLVGNWNQNNKLYLNDGTGVFLSVINIDTDADKTVSLSVADVDSDGDLDVVVGNDSQINKLYKNDGRGTFTLTISIGTETDRTTDMEFGDVDADGDLDLVVANKNQANKLYLNDASGVFTLSGAIGSEASQTNVIKLGDVDADGDLDVIAGNAFSANLLYLNNGSAIFSATGIVVGSDTDSRFDLVIGDIDGDGNLDVLTGNNAQTNKLYLNVGSGGFATSESDLGTDTDSTQEIVLGDMDLDGDLDVITGNFAQTNKLYLNDGNGGFPLIGIAIGSSDSNATRSIKIGDMDGDGDLDVVAGNSSGTNKLYLNDGSGGFPASGINIGTVGNGTFELDLGDVDLDGDLDVVVANFGQANKLYLNDGNGGFPASGIKIGDETDGTDSITLGDLNADGYLDVVVGNDNPTFNKSYLNDGTGGFPSTGTAIGTDQDLTRNIRLGDMDGDGDLDIVAVNQNSTNKLYKNNGAGVFDPAIAIGSSDVEISFGLVLGDINQDGALDVIVGNSVQLDKFYLNNGSGSFPSTGTAFGNNSDGIAGVSLGDIDNDGDLDIITSVQGNAGVGTNKLYINNAKDGFAASGKNMGTENDFTVSLEVGDMNNDGNLDVVTGNQGIDRLYLSDGIGGFVVSNISAETTTTWGISLGDIDKDGNLDVVTGNQSVNKWYKNDGTGVFAAGVEIGVETDNTQAIALGDVEGDGDLDLFVGNSGQTNKLYLNDGDGVFTRSVNANTIGIETADTRALIVADVDKNGFLDVIVGDFGDTNKVYLSNGAGFFDLSVAIGLETDSTVTINLADIDGDGDLDVLAGNQAQTNKSYINNSAVGVAIFSTSSNISSDINSTFSMAVADVDNDGDIDVIAGNLFTTNKLYLNDGSGVFLSSGDPIGNEIDRSRSLSLADMDNNGSIDLVVGNNGQTNKLYPQISLMTHARRVASSKTNGSQTDLTSIRLTAIQTSNTATTRNTSINYYLSNNGGAKWHQVTSGVTFDFPDSGSDDVRWKAELNSLSPVRTPILDQIELVNFDSTIPVTTLNGSNPQSIEIGNLYVELGATASDNINGDLSGAIVIDATAVNVNVVDSYVVTYNVQDVAGNNAVQKTRTVNVTSDVTVPVITLTGANPQSIEVGNLYVELDATASDNIDGNISGNIVIDATAVNVNVVDSYVVTYNVQDAAGNNAVQKTRTVNVTPDVTVPVITLTGVNPQSIEMGNPYVELDATASDNIDGDISGNIVIDSSAVDVNTVNSYLVTYNIQDVAGNNAIQKTRTVNVEIHEANLGINKTDSQASFSIGAPITYMITVTNAGPTDVVSALISDILPAELDSSTASWVCIANLGASCTASGNGDINELVDIPSGASVNYALTVSTTDPLFEGAVINTATVTEPLTVTDLNQINNSSTDTSYSVLFMNGFEDPLAALQKWLENIFSK